MMVIRVHLLHNPPLQLGNYKIKPNLLTMVQHNQFGGSCSKDASMNSQNFNGPCDMMPGKDVDPVAVNLFLTLE